MEALVDERVARGLGGGGDEANRLLPDPAAEAADGVVEGEDPLLPLPGDEELQRDQQEEEGDGEGDGARVHNRGRV